jgi:hypothetical protein
MSDEIDPSLLKTMRDEREIQGILLRYCRGVDRKDFELMESAYHPDAYDDHGFYKGDVKGLIAAIKARHETIDQSAHFLGNCLIELDGARAFVETYCVLYQHGRTGNVDFATGDMTYRRFTIGVRYADRLEERRGEWKIAHRVVVYEWAREELGDLRFNPDWTVARRSREDMIYRIPASGAQAS